MVRRKYRNNSTLHLKTSHYYNHPEDLLYFSKSPTPDQEKTLLPGIAVSIRGFPS